MKIQVDIPEYSPERGVPIRWQADCVVRVSLSHGAMLIQANGPGLVSLGHHLLTLAQSEVPAGSHIHYDDFMGDLEEGSCELIIEKT